MTSYCCNCLLAIPVALDTMQRRLQNPSLHFAKLNRSHLFVFRHVVVEAASPPQTATHLHRKKRREDEAASAPHRTDSEAFRELLRRLRLAF